MCVILYSRIEKGNSLATVKNSVALDKFHIPYSQETSLSLLVKSLQSYVYFMCSLEIHFRAKLKPKLELERYLGCVHNVSYVISIRNGLKLRSLQ